MHFAQIPPAPPQRPQTPHSRTRMLVAALAASLLLLAACSSDASTTGTAVDTSAVADGTTSTFTADVWADNWFALYINGELVGEDSVPITTERSFNKETIEFTATYPLTIAVEAKDFKETDSGLEYIGTDRQQMGDGGLILQITDQSNGAVVATSTADWTMLPIHQAPLDKSCENSSDPETECDFLISEAPAGWTDVGFDDSAWPSATVWSSDAVSPKDGYDEVSWSSSAALIWGADLESDNTLLARYVVSG